MSDNIFNTFKIREELIEYFHILSTHNDTQKNKSVVNLINDALSFFNIDNYAKDSIKFGVLFEDTMKGITSLSKQFKFDNMEKLYAFGLKASNGQNDDILNTIYSVQIVLDLKLVIQELDTPEQINIFMECYTNGVLDYISSIYEQSVLDSLPDESKQWLANFTYDQLDIYELDAEYALYTKIFKIFIELSNRGINMTDDLKYKILCLHLALDSDPQWPLFFVEDVNNDFDNIKDSFLQLQQDMYGKSYLDIKNIAEGLDLLYDYTFWKKIHTPVHINNNVELPVFK